MEKNYNELSGLEKGTLGTLELDRGNGSFKQPARFDGFDKNNKPRFYLRGETLLDIDKIGGYSSIISFQEECPAG